MLIISPKYYFRYTIKSKVFNSSYWHTKYPGIDKPVLIGFIFHLSSIRDMLANGQSIIEWAPHTINNQTRVKPQNVLYVDRPHYKTDIHKLMCNLPWNLDLRTISLDSYPEYFI